MFFIKISLVQSTSGPGPDARGEEVGSTSGAGPMCARDSVLRPAWEPDPDQGNMRTGLVPSAETGIPWPDSDPDSEDTRYHPHLVTSCPRPRPEARDRRGSNDARAHLDLERAAGVGGVGPGPGPDPGGPGPHPDPYTDPGGPGPEGQDGKTINKFRLFIPQYMFLKLMISFFIPQLNIKEEMIN